MRLPNTRQNIPDEDIQEVVKILKSDFITQDPMVEKFESAVTNKSEYAQQKAQLISHGTTRSLDFIENKPTIYQNIF